MSSEPAQTKVRGSVHVVDSSPAHMVTRISGYFDEQVCTELINVLDQWRGRRTGLCTFNDLSGVEDYDVTARERISQWARSCIPVFESVHVLVQGRTVAWAIKLVSLVSGMNILSFHERAAFEAALHQFERSSRLATK